MTKPLLGLIAAVLVVIAAAKFAYGVSANTDSGPVTEPWGQNTMEFVAWNSTRWKTWIHNGEFEQVPLNSASWHRHSNQSIAYLDWDDEPWQAKVEGDMFLLARGGDWQGEVEMAPAIRYRDWSGNKRLRLVSDLQR